MDIQKRLFRRPLTTALWGLLVTAMALLLCTGAALWYSSENMVATLDGMYTAAAFRTNKAVTKEGTMTHLGVKHLLQEDVDFLESLDSVEAVHFHTLTGGYSPVFQPVLNPNSLDAALNKSNQGYDDVVLIGKLVSMGPTEAYSGEPWNMTPVGLSDQELPWSWEGEIQVEQVVRGHEGYEISVGAKLRFHVSAFGIDPAEYFELNGRYLLCAEVSNGKELWCHQAILEGDSLINTRFDYSWITTGTETTYFELNHLQIWPCAVKLDGSLEDFLADPANQDWSDYLEVWDKAHHSVPVMGTDNLESMYSFLNHDVSISQGRSFTPEEYEAGAKVCIISESLAQASGLALGDTIPLSQFYITELWNNSLDGAACAANTDGLENNPTIGEFEADTEFLSENEEFTIVGIYHKFNAWDQGAWSFTVNTVFIPKAAQIPGGYGGVSTLEVIPMEEKFPGSGLTGNVNEYTDRGNYGVYLSVLLKKGHMEEFTAALEDTELYGEFFTYDQGYEAMIDSVRAVGEASRKLLYMTAAGWVLLTMLYVLLYQGSQRKNLGTMRSLGAKPWQVRRYLFGSGMALASVSVALGTGLSGTVLKLVNGNLLKQMVEITENGQFSSGKGLDAEAITAMIGGSQLPGWVMLVLMGVQITAFALILWVQAASLSRKNPRKLMGG